MAEFITPEECEAHAAQFERPLMPRAWTRAAATIRDLTERLQKADAAGIEMMRQRDEATSAKHAAEERVEACAGGDALLRMVERYELGLSLHEDEALDANARADAAEQALAALREETAALREIRRCQESIRAAGCREVACSWEDMQDVSKWQSAERAGWAHAAAPYRERIEAAGYELKLWYGIKNSRPVCVHDLESAGAQRLGERGGYPTLALLEEAAQWAEAQPASEPQETEINVVTGVDPGALGGDCTAETTWQDGAVVNVECKPEPDPAPPVTAITAEAPQE